MSVAAPKGHATRRGVVQTEHHRVPHFGDRRVRVYVPREYDGTRPFPLLVLFDGQNVFDDAGSFAGGWHAHRAVDRLGQKRSRPIVVGVDHGHGARIDELAPWRRDGSPGRAEAFVGWVAETLVSELRRRHHVVAGPAGVLVAGSSLGGLAAMYAHFRWPETFGGALSMSPSFWLGAPKIFDYVASRPVPWTSQIYLDCGVGEGGGGMHRHAERMAALLRGRGYAAARLLFKSDPKGAHGERAWRRRLPAALRFFYR